MFKNKMTPSWSGGLHRRHFVDNNDDIEDSIPLVTPTDRRINRLNGHSKKIFKFK